MSPLLKVTEKALEFVDGQGPLTLGRCTSRSLRLTRYADPTLKDTKSGTPRKAYLTCVVAARSPDSTIQRHEEGINSWKRWLDSLPHPKLILHAKLEARLLVNMGGTVLENAGLQLDRFGTAYLPGSAVKACARRTALATLRQWCETGQKPAAADDDILAPACAAFAQDKASDFLIAVLRVFGCTDLEWQDYDFAKNTGNDLAWACADRWPALRDSARAALNFSPGAAPDDEKPTRRGSVAFLPAYPHSRPDEDLELDVLTSHHPAYYGDKTATAKATDTENPIPVFFPSVAAGAVYHFSLLPVGQPNRVLLAHARTWLATGLATFGLGAKTAAGYGYFQSADFDALTTDCRAQAEADQKNREAARIASLPSDEALLKALRALKEDALRGKIKAYSFEPKYWPPTDTDQIWITLLRYFTQENPTLWNKEKSNEKSAITKAVKSLAAKLNFPLPAP